MATTIVPLYRFWQPRYWPAWLAVSLLRLIVALPQAARMAMGRALGRAACRFLRSRRRIARRNLRICFSSLDDDAIDTLTRRHFESLGMGAIELGMARWCSDAEVKRLVTVEGLEHIQAALAQGRGAMMLSGHFTAGEFAGRVLRPLLPPIAAMYRPSNNPLNNQLIIRCRRRSIAELITKASVRRLLKVLQNNQPVWYAADQAYNRRGTVVVPFFGEPATTNTAVSQIARVSKAVLVPFIPIRLDNGSGYLIRFLPALQNFPAGDATADALRINQLLEQQIRPIPEQYLWVHRRFKGRPGLPDPYT